MTCGHACTLIIPLFFPGEDMTSFFKVGEATRSARKATSVLNRMLRSSSTGRSPWLTSMLVSKSPRCSRRRFLKIPPLVIQLSTHVLYAKGHSSL